MKMDIPEFKRCCCCVPLRPGLLALGYLKLLASLCCLGFMIYIMVLVLSRLRYISDILWLLVFILLILVETSLTIVFLVGSHKKNHKLIRVYYYYSIVVLCLYILAYTVTTILEIIPWTMMDERHLYLGMRYMNYIEAKIATGLLNCLIQLYVILLIRSEVKKLKNNAKFRFSNHAATESQCTMESEDNNYKNNITTNEPITKQVDSIAEKNIVEDKNLKNINVDSDDKLYLNKYIKMKNEE